MPQTPTDLQWPSAIQAYLLFKFHLYILGAYENSKYLSLSVRFESSCAATDTACCPMDPDEY